MNSITQKKLGGIFTALNGFLYSGYYPVCVAAWAFICFAFNLQTLGLFVLIAIGGTIFVLYEDLTPIIPLFTCCVLTINDFPMLTSAPYIVMYGILAGCIVYHFIVYPFKTFYLGKLFFPLCLVSAALFLSGLLSPMGRNNYANGLLVAIATGPLMLIIYLLFLNGIKPPQNTDVGKYICYSILSATVFACFEILFIRVEADPFFFIWVRSLGWGNFNTAGAMTLISVPACFYLIIKTGKSASFLAVIIFMILTDIICRSDGSAGITLFSSPFLVVFTFMHLNKKYRKQFAICIFSIVFALCAIGIYVLHAIGAEEILTFMQSATNSNGRWQLYEHAISLFKSNPVLGIGVGFTDESVYFPDGVVNFHSTIFHVAATMGCLGIIAYAVYYFFRFKILLGGKTVLNSFAYLSFIMFEAYGLIDVCEFNIIPLMSFMTLLIVCVELTNLKAEDDCLPLFNDSELYLNHFAFSL